MQGRHRIAQRSLELASHLSWSQCIRRKVQCLPGVEACQSRVRYHAAYHRSSPTMMYEVSAPFEPAASALEGLKAKLAGNVVCDKTDLYHLAIARITTASRAL